MKCPNCNHASDDSLLLSCSECGSAFERGPLEKLQHLDFMRQWLEEYDLSDANDTVHIIARKIQEQYEEMLKEIKGEQVLEVENACPRGPSRM